MFLWENASESARFLSESAMHAILQAKKEEIDALCKKYGVAKLEVLGSANTPEFDPGQRDFDFILKLSSGGDYFARYMEFAGSLEQLLGRPVDLVSEERLKPRFLASIASTREVLFAHPDQAIAA